jgi:hypothetical protein
MITIFHQFDVVFLKVAYAKREREKFKDKYREIINAA